MGEREYSLAGCPIEASLDDDLRPSPDDGCPAPFSPGGGSAFFFPAAVDLAPVCPDIVIDGLGLG